MKWTIFLALTLALVGCASGPAHTYYNPAVNGAKFKGPPIITKVEDVKAEKDKLAAQGYTVIGSTEYGGKLPETVELQAQAKRVGSNHVIYSAKFVPNAPGSWSFRLGGGFGSGGSGGGHNDVHIVFLGK